MEFAHLHVASAYSLRHGASMPSELAAHAAEHGQPLLALTDRDGVYGAVRFVQACAAHGIAPVLGVDLALDLPHVGDAQSPLPPAIGVSPTRGGAWVDPPHPPALLRARDRRGWASLCHLISAVHSTRATEGGHADARGVAATMEQIAAHSDGLIAMLGPHSPLLEALAVQRPDLADSLVAPWHEIFGDALRIEIVSHRAPRGTLSTITAARALGWARERGITPVLTHAVRYATPRQARVVDVLDSARRLVPLDERHRDRPNAQGFLAPTSFMAEIADEIARAAGAG
ncbi:MAG: PHP domain-containing protein, partial [Candidatus Nanopelagicales bacterium]